MAHNSSVNISIDGGKRLLRALACLLLVCCAAPAMAQVQLRAFTQVKVNTATTSLTIAKPTGTAVGDVMIASVAVAGSTITLTAPSGWSAIRSVVQGTTNASSLNTYSKVADASDASLTNYTWTASANLTTGAVGGIIAFSGADPNFPVDTENGVATASSLSHAAPTLTVTQAGSMLVTSHELTSSTTWTPPAAMAEQVDIMSATSAGTGGIALQMNYLQFNTVGATGAQTAVAAASADTGATQSIVLKPVGGLTCFIPSFVGTNGTAPDSNWAVGNQGGTYGNPKIYNSRLRLTDSSIQASTYATLQRNFPGNGNKIVVEFKHYAYNGNGADGIGIILSDASMAPVSGAFGGSMGYAPKRADQAGDTTHPGFVGGWLGVAIDEFGGFSSNTEGRLGGSAPGNTPDSVSIRGSGSGYAGYPYLTGTASLTPIIDVAGATAGPGFKYRITVDHSNGINAMTSVERDTGSGYTYLIAPFDAKAQGAQAAVPANWIVSLTGATGGNANTHEIEALQVCATTQQAVALHHIEIDHGGTACGQDVVTLKACANAACTSLYGGSVNVTLTESPTSGVTATPSNTITFTGGSGQITLASTSTNYTLGAVANSPTTSNPVVCYAGNKNTCVLNFINACFNAVEVGSAQTVGGYLTPIFTKLTATSFNLDILALSGNTINGLYLGNVNVALVDPNALVGNCTDVAATTLPGITISPALPYKFKLTDGGRKTFTFTSTYAVKNAYVRIYDTSVTTDPVCSADNFSIRPKTFTLTTSPLLNAPTYNDPPTGTRLAAGADVVFTANAGVLGGYTGLPSLDPTKITDVNGGAVTVGTVAGYDLTGRFTAATGISATGTFQYHDVGNLNFAVNTVTDTSFTAVDQVTGVINSVNHGAGQDCDAVLVTSFNNGPVDASGQFGCSFGANTATSYGRFYPHHYEVTSTFTPACGIDPAGFTYIGQNGLGIYYNLRAVSLTSVPTTRLNPGYGMLPAFTVGGESGATTGLQTRLSIPTPATPFPTSFVWTKGAFTISNGAAPTPGPNVYTFSRTATPELYDAFGLRTTVTDKDGALITFMNGGAIASPANNALSPTTKFRYGRMLIDNAYGSELLALPVKVQAQYWNGSAYANNMLDNCTPLASGVAGFVLASPSGGLTGTNMNTASNLPGNAGILVSNGAGIIRIAKPSPTSSTKGAVNLTTGSSLSPWLPGTGIETFGVYKAGPVIYIRETY